MADPGKRYTAEQVAQAIRDSNGIKAVAARRLGCSRQTVVKYASDYAICREACITSRETVVDLAEGQFVAAIGRGEPWAVSMALKTLGRDRGYGDRLDLVWKEEAVRLATAYNLDPEKLINLAAERQKRAG
jgi:hypothetical protein